MSEVGARLRRTADAVRGYLDERLPRLPAGARLGPRLGGALVLATGAWALGTAGPGSPLDVELVLADEEWARLDAEARPSDLSLLDPAPDPAVRLKIRGHSWLRARMAAPPELWLRQRAAIVQDPGLRLTPLVEEALKAFRAGLGSEVAARYRAFRDGWETADETLEPLGRAVTIGRAAEAALALPLLARGEPYPPARWLAWHLRQVCPEGGEIGDLLAAAARPGTVDRTAYAVLRRMIDEILDRAGYGQDLVVRFPALG